jgi:plastocyanin
MRHRLLITIGIASLFATTLFATTYTVTMQPDHTFYPQSIAIAVGDTVTWQNPAAGGITHSVVADPPNTFNSGPIPAGQSFSLIFSTLGSQPYYCGFHGAPGGVGMSGIVFVGNRVGHAANEHVLSLNAWNFGSTASTSSGGSGYRIALNNSLFGGVSLPSGSVITGFEIDACDFDAANDIQAFLSRCAEPGNFTCNLVGSALTSGVPNCGFFSSAPLSDVVDNLGHSYSIMVEMPGGMNKIRTVRVYYKSAVRMGPATATFSDVPTTHPFYRYIEALVASGITAGCAATPPQYCPDAPLTRGQMAVFLARGLGLFWPN